jgi:hypothetical protein
MSNDKAQSRLGGINEIQSLNDMPKQVRHVKGVILNSFQNPILEFNIYSAFGL